MASQSKIAALLLLCACALQHNNIEIKMDFSVVSLCTFYTTHHTCVCMMNVSDTSIYGQASTNYYFVHIILITLYFCACERILTRYVRIYLSVLGTRILLVMVLYSLYSITFIVLCDKNDPRTMYVHSSSPR